MWPVMKSIEESSHTRRKGQATDEESSASNVERATKYTSIQRKYINRISKCNEEDYYGILALSEDCSPRVVKKAYRELVTKIHPDKNPYGEASSAFKKFDNAYRVLSDPESRRNYDRERLGKRYDSEAKWDEEFHAKAWGDDFLEEEELEADPYPKLPQIIKSVYNDAAHAVNNYLSVPTPENLAEIERYNKEIEKINKAANRPSFQFNIQYTLFETVTKEIQPIVERLSKKPSDTKSLDKLHKILKNFERTKKNFGYPSSWKLNIPRPITKSIEQQSRQKLNEGKRNENTQTRKGTTPLLGSDIDMESAPEYESDTSMESQQISRSMWKAGETRNREKILGYIPYYTTDIKTHEKTMSGVRFIIEQKNKRNPIALVSGSDVGRDVVRAYLSLQDKHDVRNSGEKWSIEDIDNFGKISGAASKPFENKARSSSRVYPNGYFLVLMKDGREYIMTRQAVRNILGKRDADQRILEFYTWAEETPPWEIVPSNWRQQRPLVDQSEIDRGQRTRERYLENRSTGSDQFNFDQLRQQRPLGIQSEIDRGQRTRERYLENRSTGSDQFDFDQLRQQRRTKRDARPTLEDMNANSVDEYVTKLVQDKLKTLMQQMILA